MMDHGSLVSWSAIKAADEAAQQRLAEAIAAEEGAARTLEELQAELPGLEADQNQAIATQLGAGVLDRAQIAALAGKARDDRASLEAEIALAGRIRQTRAAEGAAAERARQASAHARKLAKDRLMAVVRGLPNERRRRGCWEELCDIREEGQAMLWISQLDGPTARELVEAVSAARRTELPSDRQTTPEAHAVVQTHYRRRIAAWWRALDVDPAAELDEAAK
jgi:hypothetical protein